MRSVALANSGIYLQSCSLEDFLLKEDQNQTKKAKKSVNRPWSSQEDLVGDTGYGEQNVEKLNVAIFRSGLKDLKNYELPKSYLKLSITLLKARKVGKLFLQPIESQ